MRLPTFALLILGAFAMPAHGEEPATPTVTAALHNVFKLDAAMYSGSSPDNEEAFRELAQLGVTTIISVDGSQPNVALAHQFGMRYVHLPIGYDGVPATRAAELVKAAANSDGPIYVHCHHGKHRGPAAAATICRARDGWSAERADAFLHQAGTAADYEGLFRDVRGFHPPTAGELARLPATFPEVAETPDLVDAMVAIDEKLVALKTAQKAGWTGDHAQTATLLWEQLRELARFEDTTKRDADYRRLLADSEQSVEALRRLLGDSASAASTRNGAMEQVNSTCNTCHKAHRNKSPQPPDRVTPS